MIVLAFSKNTSINIHVKRNKCMLKMLSEGTCDLSNTEVCFFFLGGATLWK